jgi:hypothetical protein
MALTRTKKVLIGVAVLGLFACVAAVIAVAATIPEEQTEARPRVPTMVEARIDGALNSVGAVRLSHRWTHGKVNAQFDRRDAEGWLIFDVDHDLDEGPSYPTPYESLEIWISLGPDGFRAQALVWWGAGSVEARTRAARDIHGVVKLDAARMPEGDEERVVEYSLDATREGDPVHFSGKLVFRASDLTPAAEAKR